MNSSLRWLASLLLTLSCSPLIAEDSSSTEYIIGYMGVGGTDSEIAHVLGFIRPDASGETYPDFHKPDQLSWVFGPAFSDGKRLILCSYENTNVTKVRSGQVRTHDWIYNLLTGELTPTLEKDRPADQLRPYILLPGDERVIETAIMNSEERVFIKNLDGSNSRELTSPGSGFHYALELSHDHTRLACHVAGGANNPGIYSINVFNLESGKRSLVAGLAEHLLFGPRWSPDDSQLAYLDCHVPREPNHFRAALAVGKADGSQHRVITPEQTHWFGTPFGSNLTEWSPDGKTITYSRLLENSQRDISAGGSQICLLDPLTGSATELTPLVEGTWDYRATWAPDASLIAFCRVHPGSPRELWVMNPDGSNPRRLTDGYQHKGADHYRWLKVDRRALVK